jgi:hypothetical protein
MANIDTTFTTNTMYNTTVRTADNSIGAIDRRARRCATGGADTDWSETYLAGVAVASTPSLHHRQPSQLRRPHHR